MKPSDCVDYERGDIHARPVLWTAIAIAAGIAAVALFASALIKTLGGDPNGSNSVQPFHAEGARLQTDARGDLQSYQKEKRQRLHSYGWSDEQPRRLHIPIERAMQLLAERGRAAPPSKEDGR